MERRVLDTAKAIKGLVFEGYIPLTALYPRLRGYGPRVIADVVRAVDRYMRLQGLGKWCRADGQEGFWIGPSRKELAAEEEKARKAALPKKKAPPPPSGPQFKVTVRRVRDYLIRLPAEAKWVPKEAIQELHGTKVYNDRDWAYLISDVLRSRKLAEWSRDGLGGVIRGN